MKRRPKDIRPTNTRKTVPVEKPKIHRSADCHIHNRNQKFIISTTVLKPKKQQIKPYLKFRYNRYFFEEYIGFRYFLGKLNKNIPIFGTIKPEPKKLQIKLYL